MVGIKVDPIPHHGREDEFVAQLAPMDETYVEVAVWVQTPASVDMVVQNVVPNPSNPWGAGDHTQVEEHQNTLLVVAQHNLEMVASDCHGNQPMVVGQVQVVHLVHYCT